MTGATEYRVVMFGFSHTDFSWRNYPGYPVVVKSPNIELIANNIGYFDPFWDDDRKIRVEAYANGTLLEKGEKDIVLPEPGPVITGITNATYNSFTVSWSKTIGGTMEPWQKVSVSVENEETGELAASYPNLTTTSQVVTGMPGGTRYIIRLRGYKRVYLSYYDEWREFWSDVTVGYVYTKLEIPVALPGISIRPNAFMAQWNKTSGAKKYKLFVREKATGRMVALQASNITNNSFTARWQPVSGATGYKLWVISTSSTGLSPKGYFPMTLGNVDNHTVTGLVSGIEYLYYVQTVVSGGESIVSGTIYVTTTGATTYAVNLSASPTGGGLVSGGGTFAPGKSVTVTATANPEYAFVNWTEGTTVVSTSASYVFTLSGNRILTANFTVKTPVSVLSGSLLRVWPNPVTSELRISGVKEKGVLKLTDFSGRVVYVTSCSSSELTVPMDGYQPGIYMLILETLKGWQVRKIVKH